MTAYQRVSVLLVITLLSVIPLFAQKEPDLERGWKPNGSYEGGSVDTVSMTNGNLHVHIPLVSYPQRGALKMEFFIGYNNKSWAISLLNPGSTVYVWKLDYLNVGARLLREQSRVYKMDSIVLPPPNGNPTNYTNPKTVTIYSFRTPDGSSHQYGDVSNGFTTKSTTVDGTGLTENYDREGNLYTPTSTGATSVEDRNGNKITASSIGWTDTLGRLIPGGPPANLNDTTYGQTDDLLPGVGTTDFSGCSSTPATVSARVWNLPGFNGSTMQYKLCYAQYTLTTNYQISWAAEGYAVVNMLKQVKQPDGTSWYLDYNSWGDLSKLTFPTGGSISYNYISHQFSGYSSMAPLSRAVSDRIVDANDGTGIKTWHYSYNVPSPVRTVTSTDPSGNDTVHYGDSSYETKTEYFQGSQGGGNKLKTVTTEYMLGATNPFNAYTSENAPPISLPTKIKTILPNGLVSQIEKIYALPAGPYTYYDFNTPDFLYWGNTPTAYNYSFSRNVVTDQLEYDYGQNTPGVTDPTQLSPGPLVRKTTTAYKYQSDSSFEAVNLIDLSTSQTIYDAGNHQLAQTTYSYDEGSVQTSNVSQQHNLAPTGGGPRGNLTTVGRWRDLPSSTTLPTTTSYYDTGMPSQITEVAAPATLNATTTFTYSPANYGAYPTGTCLPTTNAITHCVSGTYDFNTGLLSSFTDQNSKLSTYSYDNMMRFDVATLADGGSVDFDYPNSTTIIKKAKLDASRWVTSYHYLDGLARIKQSQLVDPQGDIFVDTQYDALGRIWKVSNPHRSAPANTDGTSETQYDALGRVIKSIPQDGAASANYVLTDYTNNVTTVTDQAGKQRRSLSDGLGRLVQVDEPGVGQTAGTGGTPGTSGVGSATVSGAEQNVQVTDIAPAPGTGSVLIHGQEGSDTTTTCNPNNPDLCHTTTTWHIGTLSVAVNGMTKTVNWGQTSTSATIAAAIAAAFNADGTAVVTGSASGSTVYFTAKTTGPSTNYTLSTTSSTTPRDFYGTASGFNLTGGVNGVYHTAYDAGTVSLTVNITTKSVSFGQASTAATVASALASAFNADSSSPVSASVSGSTVSFTAKTVGTATNYALSTSRTFDTAHFGQSSFAAGISGSAMTGGTDAVPAVPPQPNGVFSLGTPSSTFYNYDVLGNLKQVDQKGQDSNPANWRTRTFTYDSLSRLLTANNPESGLITYSYTKIDGTQCDAGVGSICRKTDARNITTTYGYDLLHRLTGKTFSDATPAAAYAYDSYPSMSANAVGRMVWAGQGNTISYFSYDANGRVADQYDAPPSIYGQTSYHTAALYDLAGNLTSLTYPSGRKVTYGYDGASRLNLATFANFGATTVNYNYLNVSAFHPTGVAKTTTLGNGAVEFEDFNKRLQPKQMTLTTAAGTQMDHVYTFTDSNGNNNGNVVRIDDQLNAGKTQAFGYDHLNRILSAAETDPSGWGQTFSYDTWGNLLQQTATKGTLTNWSVIALPNNRLTGFSYDASGNMLNTGLHSFAFNAENQVTSLDSGASAYTYDANGNRVRKSTGTNYTEYIYFGSDPIAEKDQSGAWTDYILAAGKRIAMATGSTSAGTNYYHSDHLGSSRMMTTAGGALGFQTTYTPFGQEAGALSNATHYKFTGKERDAESGLDYFGARYYGSTMGRFVSPDPDNAGAEVNDPQSWNAYSYVGNNPITFTDPDGLARSVCIKDSSDRETCYWEGEYHGEYDENQKLYWNAQTKGWQLNNPVPKMSNGAISPGFLGPGDVFFMRVPNFGIMAKIGEWLGIGEKATVIGKMADLEAKGAIKSGERALAEDLADLGSPKANWAQNASKLREVMSKGKPIRDASAGKPGSSTGFLRAERNLLQNHGWTLKGDYWYPPSK